jgi:hypothetical protein
MMMTFGSSTRTYMMSAEHRFSSDGMAMSCTAAMPYQPGLLMKDGCAFQLSGNGKRVLFWVNEEQS